MAETVIESYGDSSGELIVVTRKNGTVEIMAEEKSYPDSIREKLESLDLWPVRVGNLLSKEDKLRLIKQLTESL